MNSSVEAECGYTLTDVRSGGNFSGVCLGIRPGGKINTLIPNYHTNLGF